MAKQINSSENTKTIFVFEKINYQLLLVSIGIVIIGFTLMAGNTDIYSFRKIVLAPIVVIGGFIFGFYAILKKTSSKA
ncbi:MAG: DUF3098 domain-containing protein [Sphingobacteriales bacterium]|jgi:hypothetical protein|nr:MAG: DUF3098 domain-containing protein [Sphingobacteriales bacterium]